MVKFPPCKIYVICSVRNQSEQDAAKLEQWVADKEQAGYVVFYPPRDAPQDSKTGFEIVEAELQAIREADEIHVFWDIDSKGSHFDLGMCYALGKNIASWTDMKPDPPYKSYSKVIKVRMDQKGFKWENKNKNH